MSRKISKRESKFNEERLDETEKSLMIELLYSQQIQINKLEKIRTNLSIIVWVIAFQIAIGIVIFFNTASRLA